MALSLSNYLQLGGSLANACSLFFGDTICPLVQRLELCLPILNLIEREKFLNLKTCLVELEW